MRSLLDMASEEPTKSEMQRGVTALVPFVSEWRLPLNPEELEEMAWAVLVHARSEETVAWIDDAVRTQLARYREAHNRMLDAWRGSVDDSLPFFAYGALKPGELAYEQIEHFVSSVVPASTAGVLVLRDGLPVLRDGSGEVEGYLLTFTEAGRDAAWATVCSFEPRSQYFWKPMQVEAGGHTLSANLLMGKSPDKGSAGDPVASWSTANDPLFSEGLTATRKMAAEIAATGVSSAPDGPVIWDTFFRLQATYLLLWSVVERYTSLRFGPTLDPWPRVTKLDEDPIFREAAISTPWTTRAIYDSRDPRSKISVGADGTHAAKFAYQVRSNLSHRGKGVGNDASLVLESLIGLHDSMREVLLSQ